MKKTNEEILKEVLNEKNWEAIIYTALGRMKRDVRAKWIKDLFSDAIQKALAIKDAENKITDIFKVDLLNYINMLQVYLMGFCI